jgi:hypothetical protein
MKVTLEAQVSAVERAVVNLKGHIEILQDLVKKKKRDPALLEMKQSWLPELEASLVTLKWIHANEAKIKEALRR